MTPLSKAEAMVIGGLLVTLIWIGWSCCQWLVPPVDQDPFKPAAVWSGPVEDR